MAALPLSALLLISFFACLAVETEAEYSIETFKRRYIDYPWTLKTQDPKYCDAIMKERGFSSQKSHVFIHAPYETIQAACISHRMKRTGLRMTGSNVFATLCVAKKELPDGSYEDYRRKALVNREAVYCDDGIPVYPLAPFYGKHK